ncbi:MAG TPA: polyphosphate kinase 2, partial [Phycicoccus sp.]|nr:polyphosphate kinase 2 [Phycicoccus sp.]
MTKKQSPVPEGADDIGYIDPVEQFPSIHTKSGRVRKDAYEAEMERLQEQLVLLQYWIQKQGLKVW